MKRFCVYLMVFFMSMMPGGCRNGFSSLEIIKSVEHKNGGQKL